MGSWWRRSSLFALLLMVVMLQSIRTNFQIPSLVHKRTKVGDKISDHSDEISVVSDRIKRIDNSSGDGFILENQNSNHTSKLLGFYDRSRNTPTLNYKNSNDMQVYAEKIRQQGGIFVFLHIPKTGGSMVREFLRSQSLPLEWRHYYYHHHQQQQAGTNNMTLYSNTFPYFSAAYNTRKWNEWLRYIREEVSIHGLQGRSVFLESHLQPHPQTLLNKVQEWKRQGIPVFAFTIVREPIAHAKSWFRFFRVNAHRANNTENDLIRTLEPNLQCQWLVKSKEHVKEKCIGMVESLLKCMDWISTTTNFDTELLPLIAYLAKIQYRQYYHNNDTQQTMDKNEPKKNVENVIQPPGFSTGIALLSNLSESTRQIVEERTQVDRLVLYRPVVQEYNFTNSWKQYLETKRAMISCQWKRKGPAKASTTMFFFDSTDQSNGHKESSHDGVCEYVVRKDNENNNGTNTWTTMLLPTGQLPSTDQDGVYVF